MKHTIPHEVLEMLKADLARVLVHYGSPPDASGKRARCPLHDDESPSLRIKAGGRQWYCDPCGKGGDVITLVRRKEGLSFHDATRRCARILGYDLDELIAAAEPSAKHAADSPGKAVTEAQPATTSSTRTAMVARYVYADAAGVIRGVKKRWEPAHDGSGKRKSFTWEHPDGAPTQPKPWAPVLYRLPEVRAAIAAGKTIHVVEGEKCADAMLAAGFAATTNEDGAGKWQPEHTGFLRGADVVVLPDNDDPGRKHARAVAGSLAGIAKSVRVVEVPGLEHKGDAADYLETHTGAELRGVIDAVLAESARDQSQGVVCLANVTPQRVEWLWKPRIPRGMLTLVDGDPGKGKSTLLYDVAARITRGEAMPDGDRSVTTPADVLILAGEDTISTTIVARLAAAGADLRRCHVLEHVIGRDGGERTPTVPGDLDRVEAVAREVGALLLIVDPLFSFLGQEVDSHKDQSTRQATTPLKLMLERTRMACTAIRHMKKGEGSAIQRGGGSIGIIAAARSALMVGDDPSDPALKVLAHSKANVGPMAPSIAYSLEETTTRPDGSVILDAEGIACVTSRVRWRGACAVSADDLAAAGAADGDGRSELGDCSEWLREFLANGPQPAKGVERAAREAGFKDRTLTRAKQKQRVRSVKQFAGGWQWVLPPVDDDATRGAGDLGSLEPLGGGTPQNKQGSKGANGILAQTEIDTIDGEGANQGCHVAILETPRSDAVSEQERQGCQPTQAGAFQPANTTPTQPLEEHAGVVGDVAGDAPDAAEAWAANADTIEELWGR